MVYYAEGDDVTSRSLEDTQAICREVSQHAFCFIAEFDGRPIGECWLQEMDLRRVRQRHPEDMDLWWIDLAIGEKEFCNHGWGTRTIALLVRFGFGECGAGAIFGCDVADYNPRSRRAFASRRLSGTGRSVLPSWQRPPATAAAPSTIT